MAGSINKVILVGNVGNDPEIRATQDGRELANLSIATSESWKDKNTGERREKTEWHRVVVFQPGLVNVIKQYIKKGSKLYVEGSLQTRKWTDNNGADRYSTEVVIQGFGGSITMLDNAGSASGGFSANNQANNAQPSQPSNNQASAFPDNGSFSQTAPNNNSGQNAPAASVDDFEDEIPF